MKIRSLILAIIFQILLIIAMLAYALMPLYLGKEIKVRVNLYDPRDLFRGNYVSLSYDFSDFSNLQQSKFDEKTGVEIYIYDRNISKNDEIYAILKQDANATYAFDKFSFTKPKDALFLAGKFDGYSFVKYGIEEFYMPTKKAKQTEREMMDQDVDTVAVLMVMDDGRARLKDLIITPNGKKRSNDKNFDEILPLGWAFIGSMNRAFFIPVYNFLASWGITAGWVIFILTIVVKLILSPITFKQHKLSAMMRVIRPEIEEVNEKFKNADPMKKQQAVMEVYRKAGVNQLAGCLPGLLQIPIFYALFRFFPNFIDLRGQSFWFAKDLTAYDDLIKLPFNVPFIGEHISILALACTSVILIYTIMTSGQMQQPTQEGMPNMKILMYIFPITFFFFLNSAASGLSWYYFVSNTINIIIILVIKYWILDEAKIHKQIQENKAKPQKESKFQKKMREMMEKAQEQQKMYEQQKKKK